MPAKNPEPTAPDTAPPAPVTEGIIGLSGQVPATIRTQQYAVPVGWRIGDIAPHDTYRAHDSNGAPVGDVLDAHPGGHATQLTTKGCQVTSFARREFDAAGFELED